MRLGPHPVLVLIVGLGLGSFLESGPRGQEQNFSPRISNFLKLATYVILPQERDVLLKLETERDRDVFIERFWKERDPTPGTPQNEFKDELIERFQHVNKFFGRGTTREGWMTDRGRIYMILGEPASKHSFYGRQGLQPCEVWYYYGDTGKGLPPYFGLVFFQRKGVGELQLYDPVSDGMTNLLTNAGAIPFDDYAALYERLMQLAPDLAPVALSIIPGEIPANYMPSPREEILLANILDLPKKAVNPSYATHFLEYRGLVSTEYMSNFIDSVACVDLVQDPLTNLTFLHFVIAPKTLSFDYLEAKGQHYCNLQLNVSLRKGESVIYQYDKDFPVYFPQSETARIGANGVSVEDAFPVIAGTYRLVVLLQNSIRKEFTLYEREVNVPDEDGRPRLMGLWAGYGVQKYDRDVSLPYAVLGNKSLIDPSLTFSQREGLSLTFSLSGMTEPLWKEGCVAVSINGSQANFGAAKTFSIPLRDAPLARAWSHIRTLPPADLGPDYYTMKAELQDGSGRTIDERSGQFIISPLDEVPHPVAQAKMIRTANPVPYYLMLAGQAEKAGRLDEAQAWYERALIASPESRRGAIEYARLLLKLNKPEKTLAVIDTIKADPSSQFDYYLIRGRALYASGRIAEAIKDLLEANSIYNSDALLMNTLGACYIRLGQKDKALAVLKASLRLDPSQDEIQKLIADIEK